MGSNEWVSTMLGELVDTFGGSVQTGPFGSQLHAADYEVKAFLPLCLKTLELKKLM
jgi:type I restriction enzyme S subunit